MSREGTHPRPASDQRLRKAMAAAGAIIAAAADGRPPPLRVRLSVADDLASVVADLQTEFEDCRRRLTDCRQARLAAARYRAVAGSANPDRRRK